MKAAIVTGEGKTPIYGDFDPGDFDPQRARAGEEIISVRAAALSNLTKSRASGSHYSSTGVFPAVAGTDGVGLTQDGRRVYFALPEAPYGALAEFCPVTSRRCVAIPDSLDYITAAAIANPGMSAWGALVERAHLIAGETVLVHGATGTAGRIAVQLAKYLGAGKIIATARNVKELEEIKQMGADVVIPFALGAPDSSGAKEFEEALKQAFSGGIDIVVDYLWGESAKTVIAAIAKTVEDAPVRFVQVGAASGEANIELAAAALRSSAIMLMGSGMGSISRAALVHSIQRIFEAVQPASLSVAIRVVPLGQVEAVWDKATGKPRVVFTLD